MRETGLLNELTEVDSSSSSFIQDPTKSGLADIFPVEETQLLCLKTANEPYPQLDPVPSGP